MLATPLAGVACPYITRGLIFNGKRFRHSLGPRPLSGGTLPISHLTLMCSIRLTAIVHPDATTGALAGPSASLATGATRQGVAVSADGLILTKTMVLVTA